MLHNCFNVHYYEQNKFGFIILFTGIYLFLCFILSLLPCYQPANLSLDKFKTIIILSQLYSISCISNNGFLLYLDKVMKINYRGLCFRSGSIPRTSSSTVGSSSTWGTVGILDSLLSNVRSQKVANGDFDRNYKISIHNLIN